MLRPKRFAVLLIAAMAFPLLVSGESLAGGGFFPSFPGNPSGFNGSLHTSGQVTAVIVLDPNGPVSSGAPATPTGTFGSIAITLRTVGTATATFQVEPDSSLGELRFGCNLLDTNVRFVEFSPGVPGLTFGDRSHLITGCPPPLRRSCSPSSGSFWSMAPQFSGSRRLRMSSRSSVRRFHLGIPTPRGIQAS